MKRALLIGVAAVVLGDLAQAAPVPVPRTAAAEFTLSLTDDAGAKQLAERIRSHAFLERVVRSREAEKLTCLKGERDRAGWLISHLRAEVKDTNDHGRVLRVRLVDCPARDALPLLKSVAGAHEERARAERRNTELMLLEHERRLMLYKRVIAQGAAVPGDLDKAVQQTERQIQQLKGWLAAGNVVQPPRLIRAQR